MDSSINYISVLQSLNNFVNTSSICAICAKSMDNEETYTLTECGHTFHTECIINWFRNCNIVCPFCNDIGHSEELKKKAMERFIKQTPRMIGFDESDHYLRYLNVKRIINKKNIPQWLKQKYSDLENTRKQYRSMIKNNNLITKSNTPVVFKEALKKRKQNASEMWKTKIKIRKLLLEINHIPIIPLIIPVRKNIN